MRCRPFRTSKLMVENKDHDKGRERCGAKISLGHVKLHCPLEQGHGGTLILTHIGISLGLGGLGLGLTLGCT